jgi:hypothetical protein
MKPEHEERQQWGGRPVADEPTARAGDSARGRLRWWEAINWTRYEARA